MNFLSGVLVVSLAVSLGANGWLAYKLFDAAVSLDHSRSFIQTLKERAAVTEAALEEAWRGRPEEDVLDFAREMEKEGRIFKTEPNTIFIDELEFGLSGGTVSYVRYVDMRGDS